MVAGLGVGLITFAAQAEPNSVEKLDGRWAARITQDGVTIPFRLDISGGRGHLTGKYNIGEDYDTTTSASFENGTLHLNFEHYLTAITAHVKDGELDGQLTVKRRSPIIITPGQPGTESKVSDSLSSFHARRYVAPTAAAVANVPNIDGVWEIPHESPKGEKAWRLIVQQKRT